MSWLVTVIIILFTLLLLRRFHSSKHSRKITSIYTLGSTHHFPQDHEAFVSAFKKPSREEELVGAISVLMHYKELFPDEQLYTVLKEFLESLEHRNHHKSRLNHITPYTQNRGWGGVILQQHDDPKAYIIGYANKLISKSKRAFAHEIFERIRIKNFGKNSTILIVATIDLLNHHQLSLNHNSLHSLDIIGFVTID